MKLYRAIPSDGVAWITGASTGIGRSLALALAREGYTVAATARSADKLATLCAEASGLKGSIHGFAGDVTDEAAMTALVADIEAKLGALALAVFNAGNYWPSHGHKLSAENVVKTYTINVFGFVYGLVPAVESFKKRGRGHVVVVSSVSGYGGLPLASAYGSSKAAVINMAAALKFDFDRMNIRIQVINPGFVDTPLTGKNEFAMPALMPVEKAAQRIADGLRSGGFEITFPRRFTWVLKAINLLPYGLYFPLVTRFTGANKPLKDH